SRWREMQSLDLRLAVPESWLAFEPVAFIAELGMLVVVFPVDKKLPHLPFVMGDALRKLDPLLLSRLGPGQWRLEHQEIVPTRYRTELGAALKYAIRARENGTKRSERLRCYLKVYRNDRGRDTYRRLQ